MRALIVDDSPAARAQARVALESVADANGWAVDVDEAAGGVEALRVLAQEHVDVLLVDLHMPDVHGLEVLSFWRARSHGKTTVRAVVISTEVSPRDRAKALEHGPVTFCEKPLSSTALQAALGLPGKEAR